MRTHRLAFLGAPGRISPPAVAPQLSELDDDGVAQPIDGPLDGPLRTLSGDATVNVRNVAFAPRRLSVPSGAVVRWRFRDPIRHDVTLAGRPAGVRVAVHAARHLPHAADRAGRVPRVLLAAPRDDGADHRRALMLVATPPIDVQHIDMNAKRRGEMRAYSKRHYGYASARLKPRVIVEHIAVADNAQAVINTFAPDVPDQELGELPGLCSHYLITGRGKILELVSPRRRCRHTVGLNHVAIGIEHVGMTDDDVLDNPKRLKASLRLTAYLRCRYGTRPERHRGDWSHASMKVYRRRLARRACETAG